jgi:hypothetical protein
MYLDKVVEEARALDHGGSRTRTPKPPAVKENSRWWVLEENCRTKRTCSGRDESSHQEPRLMSFVDEVETKGEWGVGGGGGRQELGVQDVKC